MIVSCPHPPTDDLWLSADLASLADVGGRVSSSSQSGIVSTSGSAANGEYPPSGLLLISGDTLNPLLEPPPDVSPIGVADVTLIGVAGGGDGSAGVADVPLIG